jgi:hypothetical protein
MTPRRDRRGRQAQAILFAALAAALLAPGLAAARPADPAGGLQVSFHVPAQAGGGLAVASAQWALLFLHDAAAADLALPDGAFATTRSLAAASAGAPYQGEAVPAKPVDLTAEVAPGSATLGFRGGAWGLLFVAADRIEAAGAGPARLDQVGGGRALEPLVPWPPPPDRSLSDPAFPHHAPADHAVLALGDYGGEALRLVASGVRRVEWYNATARCTMACPDGPSYQAWPVPGWEGARAELRNSTALDARGDGARLSLDGVVAAGLLGGARMDVTVDGWVRLPQAVLEGCRECGTGRTLRLDGEALGLLGLASEGGRTARLHGQLDAPGAWSALDEDPPTPLASAVAGAAAGGGVAVAVALALRALGLRGRAAPGAAQGFGHERRTGLFRLVSGEPGLTFREVERRLGWGNGVTRHHLDVLVSEGHLVARRHLNTVRYFENHGRFDSDWQAVVHRRDPDSRWLLGLLEEAPRTQREVVAVAAARGWSRSATQRRLARLVADGLVAVRPDGHGRRYAVTAGPAPPARWPVWAAGPGPGSEGPRTAPPPAAAGPAGLARPGGRAGP